MRRLVGIDAAVLDKNFLGAHIGMAAFIAQVRTMQQGRRSLSALQACVNITRARDFQLLKAGDLAQFGDNFLRNLAGRLAQGARQLKAEWQSILSQFHARGLLHDDIGNVERILLAQHFAYAVHKLALIATVQWNRILLLRGENE